MSETSSRRPRVLATRSSAKLKAPAVEETIEAPMPQGDSFSRSSIGSRFDPVRFSDIRRSAELKENSPSRTLIYVAVVVILGAVLLFLVQRFILNNDTPANTNQNTAIDTQDSVFGNEFVVIADDELSSTGVTVASNSSFTTSSSAVGSSSNNTGSIKLAEVSYQAYDKLSRTEFTLTGVTNGLPAVEITYTASSKSLVVNFKDITAADALLIGTFEIPEGNIRSITGEETADSVKYTMTLASAGKYHVSIDGSVLRVDVKSEQQLTQPSEPTTETPTPTPTPEPSPTPTPTPTTPPASSGDQPDAPHYDNTASVNKQYISSDVTGNTVASSTYFYVDNGDAFQFSWAMQGTGEASIPNTVAEKKVINGVTFIEVTMSNLYYDLMHSQAKEKATIDIPTTGSAIVDVFTNAYDVDAGTATFRVQLRNPDAIFRLHSTLTWEGYQLVSLQVFD